MFFANTMYLWALLGLAVPVAIHLWSKNEGKTIKVGSISLLKESETTQNNTLHLNEWILLLLRMLAVALLVFILAGPFAKAKTKRQDLVYLVEPGLIKIQSFKAELDSLAENQEIKLLQKGFAAYNPEDSLTDTGTVNYWQLVQDFNTLRADSIVVYAQSFAKGLKGRRPRIAENVNWITIDSLQVVKGVVAVTKLQDSVEVLEVVGDAQRLTFTRAMLSETAAQALTDRPKIQKMDTLQVYAFAEDSLQMDLRFLKAGFESLSTYLKRPLVFTEVAGNPSQDADVVIWLSTLDSPDVPGKLLRYQPDAFADALIVKKAGDFILTTGLTRENVVEEHLAEQLLPMLDLYPDLNKAVEDYDLRTVSAAVMAPLKKGGQTMVKKAPPVSLVHWLWLALIITLMVERLVSRLRKQ
ncbi:MAG: hypothetical protein CL868_17710 [Cytophagaceae bacterium]|nr:hypothetical protein [Cytophagaceae bacterium]|tara:strand:- start:2954 stop:4189 length:1236 start_codon:yes stop_codon:yes gene_type:complete